MTTLTLPLSIKYNSSTTPYANYTVTIPYTNGGVNHTVRLPPNNSIGYLFNSGSGTLSWAPLSAPTFTTPTTFSVNNGLSSGILTLDQTGAGDTAIQFRKTLATTSDWILGSESSDGGNFKLCRSTSVGVNTKLMVSTDGVTITDKLTVSGLVYPVADGAIGDVLRTNGAGQLYWGPNTIEPEFTYINVTANNDTVNGNISITQLGTGDSSIAFKLEAPARYWQVGIDASDSLFKISNSNNLGVNEIIQLSLGLTYVKNRFKTGPLLFPAGAGVSGQVLMTDGVGTLYWGTASGGGGGGPIFTVPIAVNVTSSDTTPLMQLNQLGSGSVATLYSSPAASYVSGIHAGKYRISRGAVIGTDDLFVAENGLCSFTTPLKVGAYTLPATDGTIGQILSTNGAGVVSWGSGGGGGGPPFSVPVDINVASASGYLLRLNQTSTGVAGATYTAGGHTYSAGVSSARYRFSSGADLGINDLFTFDTAGAAMTIPLTLGAVSPYTLPNADGAVDQVLQTNGAGAVTWQTIGGASNAVVKGGQVGPITLGTTNSSDVAVVVNGVEQASFQTDGDIVLGNVGTSNSVFINGGMRCLLRRDSSGTPNINLTINDYFISVDNAGTTTVTLPASVGNGGRMYVISRGFAGGAMDALRLLCQLGDTIDGDAEVQIPAQNARILVISDGAGSWLIM